MILERDGLASVMKQYREVEQLRLVQFVEDSGIAFIPFGFGLAQAVQIFDGLSVCSSTVKR